MIHERQMHDCAWFVTLTYSDENLPRHPAYGTLLPDDSRAFIKSLRKIYPPKTLSYFLVGEYGDHTHRPHYHAVLYGADFPDRTRVSNRPGPPVWESPTLAAHWPHGFSEFSSVTMASASYVAGYVQKKVLYKDHPNTLLRADPETGELHELKPEFARMSLNPAIGRRWIEKHWRDVYPRDYVVVDGVESKPPRYYDKWMADTHPDDQHDCREHQKVLYDVKQKRYESDYDDSPYKRHAREKILAGRLSLTSRRTF